jgi:serine/threonine-protein kinase
MLNDRVLLVRQRTCYSIPRTVKATNGREYDVGDFRNAGGNAVVHECIDKLSGDSYAIKFQVELKDNRPLRFAQEVDLLRCFNDPHIIGHVADGKTIGERQQIGGQRGHLHIRPGRIREDEVPFVVLQLATASLSELVKNRSKLPSAEYLGQFIGLTRALVKINEIALHRDIKPENILVMGNTWMISDFGLCDVLEGDVDLSGEDEKIGPIFWMSPEALNKRLGCGDQICEASDVYQLACVFWYAACGRHPSGIVEQADWSGPDNMFPVFRRALAHDHSRRFATSMEFCEALLDAIGLTE